jgi:hypothetical protein
MSASTYSIDTYGDDPDTAAPGGAQGISRLTHREARGRLASRLRALADTDAPPPHRGDSWSAVAEEALRAAALHPGRGSRVAATARNGCVVTMHRAAIDTSRPCVAVIMPEDGSDLPRVCLGYWQSGGGWADADVGPGGLGLAEAIRAEVARTPCSVACQSFTGETTRPYRYDAGSPAEDGSLRLPRDPGEEDRGAGARRPDADLAREEARIARRSAGLGDKELSDIADELLGEVMLTAVALEDILTTLLEELPDDASPGRENAAVLFEMVAGTIGPAVAAAGEEECQVAIALVAAIRERVLADLLAASEKTKEDRP